MIAAIALALSSTEPLAAWWKAEGPAAREALIPELLASDASFDELEAALRLGRPYSADVPRGKLLGTRDVDGVPLLSLIHI